MEINLKIVTSKKGALPTSEEQEAAERMIASAAQGLEKMNIPTDLFFLKANEDLCALCIINENNVVCYIRIRKISRYIALPENCQNALPEGTTIGTVKSFPGIIRVGISGPLDVQEYTEAFLAAVNCCIQGYKTFDCCGRYEKCSDAKRCVHPDTAAALGCTYKRNLEQGRIFYGKNRTI